MSDEKTFPTRTPDLFAGDFHASHHNQRFYDKKTGRVVQKGLQQTVADPKTGGQLNPQWVAWLMGYPTEYLSCVPWETRSSRKSQRK